MSGTDLVRFALTALGRHRLRSLLSLLGVSIGVAAVIALTALGEGARRYVIGQFSSLGSNLVVLIPGKNETTGAYPGVGGVAHDLTFADARALDRGIPGLRVVVPISMGNETVAHGERRRQVMVVGATHAYKEARELEIAAGKFLPAAEMERGSQIVVLGAKVAHELFPHSNPIGQVVRIGNWRIRVIGVLRQEGTQIGLNMDDLVIIPTATSMRIFNRSSLFRILLRIDSHERMLETCDKALGLLADRHGEEDVTCVTQESVVSSLSSILNVLTLALAGIAAISLSVAGIGIMNLMLVSVSERTCEVGLLKAVGASNRQVLALFLTEAILLAATGGMLGLGIGALGIQILVWIYPAFPAATPLWAVGAAEAVSFIVGGIFGILPARRAMRLDPIAALSGV